MGDLIGGLLVERLASGGLGAGWNARLTTRRILISLCRFSFFSFLVGLWLVWALVESLSLMHAGDFQRRPLLLNFSQIYVSTPYTDWQDKMRMWGWPKLYISTVCDHIFGDFPAKNTVHLYTVYMWFWPTPCIIMSCTPVHPNQFAFHCKWHVNFLISPTTQIFIFIPFAMIFVCTMSVRWF